MASGSKCRTCGRLWTGTTQAHCSACHRHFSTVSLFDIHIVAGVPGSCHDPVGSKKRQVRQRPNGMWCWEGEYSHDAPGDLHVTAQELLELPPWPVTLGRGF